MATLKVRHEEKLETTMSGSMRAITLNWTRPESTEALAELPEGGAVGQHLCGNKNFYGAFVLNRRVALHAIDATRSIARRCRFLAARRSQRGRVIAEK